MDNIIDFFKNLITKWKPKKTQTADKTFAMEILTLVQEAMDHVEDPETVTTVLAKIQQLASDVLGESTKLLTGPEVETPAVETVVVGDENGITVIETVEENREEVPSDEENPTPENVSETSAEEVQEEANDIPDEPHEETSDKINMPDETHEEESTIIDKADEVAETETTLESSDVTKENEPVKEEQIFEKTEKTEEKITIRSEQITMEDIIQKPEKEEVSESIEEVIPEPEPIHPERFAGKKILYAYGNAGENSRIKAICEGWQMQLEMVSTGLLAVKAFSGSEAGTYDAVILEKSMPLMNGFMAAKCIRKDKHTESETVPIIVTAFDSMTGQNEKDMEFVTQVVRDGTEEAVYAALDAIWPEEA